MPEPKKSAAPSYGSQHWPTELSYSKAEKILNIAFDTGEKFSLPAEFLRVVSPSAEVQGHGPGQEVTVAGRAHVGIMEIEPVGNYAVKIAFDDLHDTGLYSWDYLYEIAMNKAELWDKYLKDLAAKGLSREPVRH